MNSIQIGIQGTKSVELQNLVVNLCVMQFLPLAENRQNRINKYFNQESFISTEDKKIPADLAPFSLLF